MVRRLFDFGCGLHPEELSRGRIAGRLKAKRPVVLPVALFQRLRSTGPQCNRRVRLDELGPHPQ